MKRTHAVAGGLVLATLAVAVLLTLLPRPTDRDDRLTLEYGVAQVAPVDSASPAGDRRNEAGPLSATPETPAIAGRDQPSFGISQRTDVAAATEAAPAVMARSKPALAAPALPPAPVYQDVGRDRFDAGTPNPVKVAAEEPVSTFSIDVDTASYAFVRRELNRGVLPQKAAVRIEEFVNYFDYDYPVPDSRDTPFRPTVVVYPTPWNPATRLVQIGIQGYALAPAQRPRANLVFLIDVSGSMDAPDKLPLLKNALRLLVERLQPQDSVAIVTYAGAPGTVLEPTAGTDKHKILRGARAARRRRLDGRRRRASARPMSSPEAQLRQGGGQPRDPRHRRRLQRRHHRPGRAQGLRRAQARERHLSCRCSASARATTTTR